MSPPTDTYTHTHTHTVYPQHLRNIPIGNNNYNEEQMLYGIVRSFGAFFII